MAKKFSDSSASYQLLWAKMPFSKREYCPIFPLSKLIKLILGNTNHSKWRCGNTFAQFTWCRDGQKGTSPSSDLGKRPPIYTLLLCYIVGKQNQPKVWAGRTSIRFSTMPCTTNIVGEQSLLGLILKLLMSMPLFLIFISELIFSFLMHWQTADHYDLEVAWNYRNPLTHFLFGK